MESPDTSTFGMIVLDPHAGHFVVTVALALFLGIAFSFSRDYFVRSFQRSFINWANRSRRASDVCA